MGKMPMPRKIMGRMPMPQQNLSVAAPAESDNVVYSLCGTGVSPVMTHGQDAHATAKPGEENNRWVRRCGIADSRIEIANGAGKRGWRKDGEISDE
jgi:hypothetical protein